MGLENDSSSSLEAGILAYLAKRVPADVLESRLQEERTYGFTRLGREPLWRYWFGRGLRKAAGLGISLSGLSGQGRRNALDLRLNRREDVCPRLPRELDGLRILHISDTHIDLVPELAERIAALVEGLDYDICVHTGDFRERTLGDWRLAVSLSETYFKALKTPVFCVLGNHDILPLVEPLEAMGARFLIESSEPIQVRGTTLYLAGIDDPYHYGDGSLKTADQGIPEGMFKVLLAHEIKPYAEAECLGYGLMLSGHTHGGQINPYAHKQLMANSQGSSAMLRGSWCYGQLLGYTSWGVGCSAVPARFNCPPEIVLHTLRTP